MNETRLFKKILRMKQDQLKEYLEKEMKKRGYETINQDGFLYCKGEVPVLLVAHMDTVHKQIPYIILNKKGAITSPEGIGGDDRCGIYMILNVTKDIKCSVVFCEDEEIGCVGADKFAKSDTAKEVKVNYIIEFDRRGSNDAVFYQGNNLKFEEFITNNFFKTACGSYSDICDIAPALGVMAVNLSCGYYSEHTKDEKVIPSEMHEVIKQAKRIIREDSDTTYVWAEYERPFYTKPYSYSDDETYYYDGLERPWEITFLDENGKEEYDEIYASSEDEVIVDFVINHPNIPYKNVTEIRFMEDYDEDLYEEPYHALKDPDEKNMTEVDKAGTDLN